MPDKIGRKQFEELLQFKMTPSEVDLVMEAYELSKHGHRGQKRDNGTRYFEHPKSVALVLIQEFAIYDYEMIIAGLLHDAPEDTYIFGDFDKAFGRVAMRFGDWVGECVRLLSKERKERVPDKAERDRMYFENLDRADTRMKVIKIADRIHNLRELHNCTPDKQQHYLEETEAHYVPLVQEVMSMVPENLSRKLHETYKEMEAICEATRKSLQEAKEAQHESQ
jgi:(p)ppGpp synthase/HD superfamily hydrolase